MAEFILYNLILMIFTSHKLEIDFQYFGYFLSAMKLKHDVIIILILHLNQLTHTKKVLRWRATFAKFECPAKREILNVVKRKL